MKRKIFQTRYGRVIFKITLAHKKRQQMLVQVSFKDEWLPKKPVAFGTAHLYTEWNIPNRRTLNNRFKNMDMQTAEGIAEFFLQYALSFFDKFSPNRAARPAVIKQEFEHE